MVRSIPDPGFSGDDGGADPRVAGALARYDAGEADEVEVLDALLGARLLVPVVAAVGASTGSTAESVDEAGPTHDKASDMAAVLLTGADGRMALLGFTGTGTLTAWNPEARPVPVGSRVAAQAALAEGAAALVVDVAGPVRFVVEGDDLVGLASGMRLVRVGGRTAWIGGPGE